MPTPCSPPSMTKGTKKAPFYSTQTKGATLAKGGGSMGVVKLPQTWRPESTLSARARSAHTLTARGSCATSSSKMWARRTATACSKPRHAWQIILLRHTSDFQKTVLIDLKFRCTGCLARYGGAETGHARVVAVTPKCTNVSLYYVGRSVPTPGSSLCG